MGGTPISGVDPEFLHRGFKFTKGVRFVNFTILFINFPDFAKILYENEMSMSPRGFTVKVIFTDHSKVVFLLWIILLLCFVFVLFSCLFIAALWSPAGNLRSDLLALLYVMYYCA